MTDDPLKGAAYRDEALLWRYIQHQEEVQYERMARTYRNSRAYADKTVAYPQIPRIPAIPVAL